MIYPGLCIAGNGKTANVHRVGDEVYFGMYADKQRDDICDGCIGCYRMPRGRFEAFMRRSIDEGCAVYTLVKR